MVDIKVGMYVKTKEGIIAKYINEEEDRYYFDSDIYWYYEYYNDYIYKEDFDDWLEEKFLKASYNIIDLIEEGDLIVIEYYVSKYRERISRIFEVTKDGNKLYFDNCHCRWSYDLLEHKFLQAKGYNPKIKSIVTHEQFESMKYEVE